MEEDEEDEKPPQKTVQPTQGGGGKDFKFEVYVRGLSFQATEDDLKELFSECGEVHSINLLKRPDGSSKGICFVRFNEEDAMTKAIEFSGSEHMGRTITIEKT
jgi:nucleolin